MRPLTSIAKRTVLSLPTPFRRLPHPHSAPLAFVRHRTSGLRWVKPTKFPLPPSFAMDVDRSKVLVFGAGNFGSCLADHLADSYHTVFLWSRYENAVRQINETHRSDVFKDHVFPDTVKAVGPEFPSRELIKSVDVLLFAIPTEGVRETLTNLRPLLDEGNLPLLIFVNKGIEIATNALTLEIIADTCGPAIANVATFISGPSFAKEIIKRQPTSVSVVSLSVAHAQRASHLFHQPWFRCYTGEDPIGVELAGALKNVYAIASGMADGLGFENNTRASLITRGLAEMTRIGTTYGASPLTFLSLAGVGDLFLTCSSSTSRNYTVGYRLGKGEKLDHIIKTLGSVAEGVTTTKALHTLISRLGVNAPIATGIYEVLYEDADVAEKAKWLMALPPVRELELPEGTGKPAEQLLKKLELPGAV